MVVTRDTRFKLDARGFTFLLVISCSMVLANSGSSVKLAYKCLDAPKLFPKRPPVIFLHGLIDSKETWDGIYEVIPRKTNRRVCIYDARNHGDSSWNDTFSVDVLAEDLRDFMRDRRIKRASLVGHSLGGLTVMKFAFKYPHKVASVFVEDISPKHVEKVIVDSIRNILLLLQASLSAVPPDADEKTAIKAILDYLRQVTNETIPEEPFQKPVLRFRDGKWQWKANIEVFLTALEDADSFVGDMDGLYKGRSFFIYGEESDFKVFEDKDLILSRFPRAKFFGVEGAGHGVHSFREIYIKELVKFLNSR